MDYVGMGRRIRRGRRQCHLTQEALSEIVEVSLSFIGHIERGTRKASLETVVKVCEALRMSLDEVVLGFRPEHQYPEEEYLLREINRLLEPWRDNQ